MVQINTRPVTGMSWDGERTLHTVEKPWCVQMPESSVTFPLNLEQYYLDVFLSLLSRWNFNVIGLLCLCVVGITGLHAFFNLFFFIPLRTNIHASWGGWQFLPHRSKNTIITRFLFLPQKLGACSCKPVHIWGSYFPLLAPEECIPLQAKMFHTCSWSDIHLITAFSNQLASDWQIAPK